MSTSTRPRLPRQAKKTVAYQADDLYDPALPTENPLYQQVNALNDENYPAKPFAALDDDIVFLLFASKYIKTHRWNSMRPDRSSTSKSKAAPNEKYVETMTEAQQECFELTHPEIKDPIRPLETVVTECVDILFKYDIFQPRTPQRRKIIHHLLFRYGLLYRPNSAVRNTKVQFLPGGSVSFGLVALKFIPAGTCILETCSSLSSDPVNKPGPSIIEWESLQYLILGGFRYGNHCCDANGKIGILRHPNGGKKKAAAIFAEVDIHEGEEITVKYTKNGYYGDACLCKTCTGNETTGVKRSLTERAQEDEGSDAEKAEASGRKRKTRRGGARIARAAKRRRENGEEGTGAQ